MCDRDGDMNEILRQIRLERGREYMIRRVQFVDRDQIYNQLYPNRYEPEIDPVAEIEPVEINETEIDDSAEQPEEKELEEFKEKYTEDREMEVEGSGKYEAVAEPEKSLETIVKTEDKPVGSGKPKRNSKRNEIVKKVMAEKGMKLIEASKYVKEHNLYQK